MSIRRARLLNTSNVLTFRMSGKQIHLPDPQKLVLIKSGVSSFLTAHQHILGYSVPFLHSVLFTVW